MGQSFVDAAAFVGTRSLQTTSAHENSANIAVSHYVSWIDIVWPMMAAASLTLGLIQLLIWLRQRSRWEHLAFFVLAVSVAGFGAVEWLLIRASSPEQYGHVQRWLHLAVFTGEISIAAFVRLHLQAGRSWLFWCFCTGRLVALLLNFLYGASINYLEVTALRPLQIWGGETVPVPVGVVNPLESFDELINLLLVVFLADACVSAWRRGDRDSRRSTLVVGGAFLVFFLVAAGQAALLHRGIVEFPYVVTFAFLGIVLVVVYELGSGILQTAQFASQLRESEQRMELAADAARLGLWEWNVARDEIWATDRGRTLFGFAPGKRIDFDRFMERVHPEDRNGVSEAVGRALRAATGYDREYRIALPDGTTRWIAARGRVERMKDGAPALMRGVVLDITERKDAEQRALQLESEAARQRNELAHLSRIAMLGELSGALAHELNQPLAAILSNAQAAQRLLARDPPNSEMVREILSDIVKNDQRAGEVIRRLRALFRKEEPRHQPLDMNGVVREVLALTRSNLLDRRVVCDTELALELPPVSGDRVQLQQVLLNLVINACDAMANGVERRRLVVRTETTEPSGIRVSVIDSGSGIPQADLERVFEPFVTTKPAGMGLGLAICRTIVQAHGGRLWAMNNKDGGATVQFGLPGTGS